jgi:cold shock CspA family protein
MADEAPAAKKAKRGHEGEAVAAATVTTTPGERGVTEPASAATDDGRPGQQQQQQGGKAKEGPGLKRNEAVERILAAARARDQAAGGSVEAAGGAGQDGPGTGKCTGTAGLWNDNKGFGFIKPDEGAVKELFCHMYELTDGNVLEPGARVRFDTEWGADKSAFIAVNVTVRSSASQLPASQLPDLPATAAAASDGSGERGGVTLGRAQGCVWGGWGGLCSADAVCRRCPPHFVRLISPLPELRASAPC